MNFNSPNYLPNSEQRLENLRRIINGRPVAILAAGPSIRELEERIEELRNEDICYFGINNYRVQEENILKKINKHFSVVLLGANRYMPPLFNNIVEFLNRNEDNLYISSHYKDGFEDLLGPDFDSRNFFNKYDRKLLFLGFDSDKTLPDNNRPLHFLPSNSVAGLIYLAIIGKASKIILFGGDGGGKKDSKEMYYRPGEYGGCDPDPDRVNAVMTGDANRYINPGVPVMIRNIYRTYGIEPVPMLNCSEVSSYTPVPKVSYNDAFDVLLGKKNPGDVTDLRIPAASIIVPHSGDEKELQDTLKNISGQSYTNYETIPVQRSPDFLDTLKKGLASARGKYIFYCPAGAGYWHHNWINSCLEVLENGPGLSLAWGLSQDLLPDGAPGRIGQSYLFSKLPLKGKKYLYYWLKKKNFFPPNALCVRREVLEKCMFSAGNNPGTEFGDWLNFSLNFNSSGYLPVFIPETAAYNKYIGDEGDKNNADAINTYRDNIDAYKHRLIFKKTRHSFRGPDGSVLPGKFYLSVFLFYDLAKKIKNNLPRPVQVSLYGLKDKVRKIVKTRLS